MIFAALANTETFMGEGESARHAAEQALKAYREVERWLPTMNLAESEKQGLAQKILRTQAGLGRQWA